MSSKQKKIIGTTTAVILVLALGLAGTFAASGSEDSAGNIEGTVDTSIFLHDDFSKIWDGDTMDRDVYVENTGDTSLYVRMRLDEFMSYGGKKLAGGDKDLKSTWKPHVPAGANVTDCGTDIHDYFTIQMGNDTGIKYKPKTKNAYNPAITEADKTKTTSTANIMLIEDYLNAEQKPKACWVLDTADGYAYWHTQLEKDKATGLILNSITNTGLIDESYYYGINVKAEAVTEMDLNAWLHGRPPKDSATGEAFDQASTNAIRLLKNMSPKYIEITQEMKDNGASDYDSDNDGYLTKKENAEYEAEKGVTPTPDLPAKDKIKAANAGDTVSLKNNTGNHPYGESTDWIVLSKDENEAVLITEGIVTVRQYHTSTPYPTWKKSDLRAWLNGEQTPDGGEDYSTGDNYIDTLGTEVKQILKTENIETAHAYTDWDTKDASADKVYLLTETWKDSGKVGKNPDSGAATSLMDVNQMKCDFNVADGKTDSGADSVSGQARWWWLRSPKRVGWEVGQISCLGGNLSSFGITSRLGVRPAE